MNKSKLGTSVVAALITLAGAAHLAQPAEAAAAALPMKLCSATQLAYAQGFADGDCGGAGTVDFCIDNGDGGISFGWSC